MELNKIIYAVAMSLFISCSSSDGDGIISPGETEARYRVTVTGNWTSGTHPTDYPSNSHFSPVIGMTHKSGVSMFKENELATEGIEVMAETGGTSPLDDEINAIINTGMANTLIAKSGLSSGSSTISFELDVDIDFSYVTLVTMIAPSPDWFVAIENVNLYGTNSFLVEKTVNAVAYDAGTDSGTTFASADADTDPAENITLLVAPPLGDGNEINPHMLSVRFEKMEIPY